MIVIVPHPDTRECSKHYGEYEIPGVRQCDCCYADAMQERLLAQMREAFAGLGEPDA